MLNALTPREYMIVHEAFKSLAQADWFERNEANEKACAKLVLSKFDGSSATAEQLRHRCLDVAKERFSRHD